MRTKGYRSDQALCDIRTVASSCTDARIIDIDIEGESYRNPSTKRGSPKAAESAKQIMSAESAYR